MLLISIFLEDIPEPYMFRVLFIYTPIGFSINSRSVVHLECARTYWVVLDQKTGKLSRGIQHCPRGAHRMWGKERLEQVACASEGECKPWSFINLRGEEGLVGMVQSGKWLPQKREDLSSDSQHIQIWLWGCTSVIPALWREEDARVHWPVKLAESVNTSFRESPCLKI